MAVALELSARVRSGEFMLQGHGVLKLEVQMECAQWPSICPLSLEVDKITKS